jgi:hypothetical protein
VRGAPRSGGRAADAPLLRDGGLNDVQKRAARGLPWRDGESPTCVGRARSTHLLALRGGGQATEPLHRIQRGLRRARRRPSFTSHHAQQPAANLNPKPEPLQRQGTAMELRLQLGDENAELLPSEWARCGSAG